MTSKTELLNKLRRIDEVTLLELLEINATDLVDAFLEKINERLEYLYQETKDLEE